MLDNNLKNNRGFTLIEALVGIGLLGIVMVVGTQGYEYVKRSQEKITTMNTTENRVSEIIQTVKANISQQIISFPASLATTTSTSLTDPEKVVADYIEDKLTSLPMAWSTYTDSTTAECPTCPGKYGYVITSVPGYGGLYNVTIRFTHTDWGTTPKTYSFVVSQ